MLCYVNGCASSTHLEREERSADEGTDAARAQAKEKVTIVGSGNWGSAIAKIIGRNVLDREEFDNEVKMWVYQEQVDGKNLTDIINTEHENVKYLPVRTRFHLTA